MRLIAVAFCLFIASLGAVGVFDPGRLLGVVRRFQSRDGIRLLAAIRVAFGGALFLIAVDTRHPALIRGLGIFVIAAGLVTPLFGVERFGRILEWWSARDPWLLRAWATIALFFGLGLGWAVLPGLNPD